MNIHHRPRFLTVLLIAVATLLAIPVSTLAAPPTTNVIDESFTGQMCGVDVQGHLTGTETVHTQQVVVQEPGNDWFIGIVKQKLTIEWTSMSGTLLFTTTFNRTFNDVSFEYLGDDYELGPGYYRAVYSVNGMAISYKVDNRLIVKDTGHIVFEDVFYLGDINNPDDDQAVSETVLQVSGPHPLVDGSNFCQIIGPYLP